MSYLAEEVQNKWKPILEHQDLPEIKDAHKRAVTAQILENTEKAVAEARAAMSGGFLGEAAPTNVVSPVLPFITMSPPLEKSFETIYVLLSCPCARAGGLV